MPFTDTEWDSTPKMGSPHQCPEPWHALGQKTGNQRKRSEMKTRMKTTATLLTAILIAMIGVMQALAETEATVPMSVTILEIEVVSITALPASITFPDVTQGDAVGASNDPVVVTNTGNVDVTIDVTITGTDQTFYEDYLETSPDGTTSWAAVLDWNAASHMIPHTTSNTEDVYLQIDMDDIPTATTYTANLLFTASKYVPP